MLTLSVLPGLSTLLNTYFVGGTFLEAHLVVGRAAELGEFVDQVAPIDIISEWCETGSPD